MDVDLRWTAYRNALRRVATAESRLSSAQSDFREASLRAAASSSDALLGELARCELRERRARATIDRARTALAATRESVLRDRAAVPTGFRRRTDLEPRVISLYGRATPAPPSPAAVQAPADAQPRRRTVSRG